MAVVVTLIMGLSNYFLFNDDMPTMIQGVVWLGNLVAFFLWVAVVVGWLRRWKFAPGLTLFWGFPFSTGSEACMIWRYHRPLEQMDQAIFTLQCVHEAWVVVKSAGRMTHTLVQEHLWSVQATFSGAELAGRRKVALRFPVPPDAKGSQLSCVPAIYWQLLVEVQVPDLDLRETHLIPIY
jgi:hypothetical protein